MNSVNATIYSCIQIRQEIIRNQRKLDRFIIGNLKSANNFDILFKNVMVKGLI